MSKKKREQKPSAKPVTPSKEKVSQPSESSTEKKGN